jgi:integrase
MAVRVIFKLKEPQAKIPPAAQKETPVNLFFNYGYFVLTRDGKKKYTPLKYATGEKIKPCYWKDKPVYRAKQSRDFDYENFNTHLDNVEGAAKKVFRIERNKGNNPNPDQLRDLLSYELKRKLIPGTVTLNGYLKQFLLDIKSGHTETADKKKFKYSTIRSFEGLQQQFDKFQKEKGKVYSFSDITMDFYDDFVRFFNDKKYSPNTIGKHIKSLKIVMHRAKDEGLHTNSEIDRKKFKAINIEVQNIYLTEKDIEKLIKVDLTGNSLYDSVRDIFLVGYFTAQRFSDYSRICKDNIRTLDSGGKVIDLVQHKTGERVIIPIRPELDKILKKYHYTLPKSFEQKVNENIKHVAEKAKITDIILVKKVRGGMVTETPYKKNKLIKTHTARRSGATNMYLAGIPTTDIMKLTGHKTEKEFRKYLLVDKEQTADNLLKHPYFKTRLKIAK